MAVATKSVSVKLPIGVVHHAALSRIYLSKDCSVLAQDSCSSSNHLGDPLRFFRGDLQRGCCGVEVPFQKVVQFLDSELISCHLLSPLPGLR